MVKLVLYDLLKKSLVVLTWLLPSCAKRCWSRVNVNTTKPKNKNLQRAKHKVFCTSTQLSCDAACAPFCLTWRSPSGQMVRVHRCSLSPLCRNLFKQKETRNKSPEICSRFIPFGLLTKNLRNIPGGVQVSKQLYSKANLLHFISHSLMYITGAATGKDKPKPAQKSINGFTCVPFQALQRFISLSMNHLN